MVDFITHKTRYKNETEAIRMIANFIWFSFNACRNRLWHWIECQQEWRAFAQNWEVTGRAEPLHDSPPHIYVFFSGSFIATSKWSIKKKNATCCRCFCSPFHSCNPFNVVISYRRFSTHFRPVLLIDASQQSVLTFTIFLIFFFFLLFNSFSDRKIVWNKCVLIVLLKKFKKHLNPKYNNIRHSWPRHRIPMAHFDVLLTMAWKNRDKKKLCNELVLRAFDAGCLHYMACSPSLAPSCTRQANQSHAINSHRMYTLPVPPPLLHVKRARKITTTAMTKRQRNKAFSCQLRCMPSDKCSSSCTDR